LFRLCTEKPALGGQRPRLTNSSLRVYLLGERHRSRKHDRLYSARRTVHSVVDPLTDQQRGRLVDLFAADEQVQVEATRGIHQGMIAGYREPDRARGQQLTTAPIAAVSGPAEAIDDRSGTGAAPPSAFAMSATSPPEHDWRLAASGLTDTLNGEEPGTACRRALEMLLAYRGSADLVLPNPGYSAAIRRPERLVALVAAAGRTLCSEAGPSLEVRG
jgi:hypothetical protein